ncbi:MAG: galactokinase [Alkalispirochaetaceae bacterium]
MSNLRERIDSYLNDQRVKPLLSGCYADTSRQAILNRFASAAEALLREFPEAEPEKLRFVSTPGRSELGGNHTDHNLGCVVAGSIELDALAAVVPTGDNRVRLRSEGFDALFDVDLSKAEPQSGESGTQALIRGVAARFEELGHQIGGFAAYLESRVLPGSGMSSSAAIEVLLGTILSQLYNDAAIGPIELAKIGQYAENNYMGKPCGLMDQIACAHGGVVGIDFERADDPEVTGMEVDLLSRGYRLAIVDTGGSHAELTDAYAAVPREMRAVARVFGKEYLRGVTEEEIIERGPDLRESVGDRALLRALHFVSENRRAQEQREALAAGDLERFLTLARESGLSSWRFLQNCVSPGDPADQPLATGLAVAETILRGRGVARVHGGGFAGTMQVFLPTQMEESFVEQMERLFGNGCVTLTGIRPLGTTAFPVLGNSG